MSSTNETSEDIPTNNYGYGTYTANNRTLSNDFEYTNKTYADYFSNSDEPHQTRYPSFNFSLAEVYDIMNENMGGSYLGTTSQIILMTVYVIMMLSGFMGNVAVIFIMAKTREKFDNRNIYVVNLLITDLTLCVFCMPFTLISLMEKNWTLGNAVCKLVPVLQCSNILVSSATIVAIAVDRYLTIIRFGCKERPKHYNKICLLSIWIISLIFPLPLFKYYYVEPVTVNKFLLYRTCVEKWSSFGIKMSWLGTLITFQYIIPMCVLGFVHYKIKWFLEEHTVKESNPSRKHKELKRNHRTMGILSIIALSFAFCWLPLHAVNFVADLDIFSMPPHVFYAAFGTSHLIAMSTVIINPVLYVWLNTNLRREMKGVMASVLGKHSNNGQLSDMAVTSAYPDRKLSTPVFTLTNEMTL